MRGALLSVIKDGFRARVQADTLSANREFVLPDKSGTIAITDDVIANVPVGRPVVAIANNSTLGAAHWGRVLTIAAGTLTLPSASSAPAWAEATILKTTGSLLTISLSGGNTFRGDLPDGATVRFAPFESNAPAYSLLYVKQFGATTWLIYTHKLGSAKLDRVEITTTSATLTTNRTHHINNATLCTAALPPTAATGDMIRVVGVGAGLFRVSQAAGQQIHFGGKSTATGGGGWIDSLRARDSITLECVIENNVWQVISSIGNFDVVE